MAAKEREDTRIQSYKIYTVASNSGRDALGLSDVAHLGYLILGFLARSWHLCVD